MPNHSIKNPNTEKERIAIVTALRTPMARAGGKFKKMQADQLGAVLFRELMMRSSVGVDEVDEVIIGNVIQPSDAANIARVIALNGGVPRATPAHTVHRNCASGMQAVTDAAEKIQAGRADVVLAGGVESMTHAPLLFHDQFRAAMAKLPKAKSSLLKSARRFSKKSE